VVAGADGHADLYDLSLSFEVDGALSDLSRTKFGIREITSEVSELAPDRLKRLFKINGKEHSDSWRWLDARHDDA